MNWETISQLAQVLEGVAVLAAILFGYVQLKQYRQQRNDNAAIELMRSFHDADFIYAFHRLWMDENGSDVEYERAAFLLAARFETFGQIAFRESIPFHLIDELVGGAVVGMWHKIRPLAEKIREEQNYPQLFEWFQWLAERLEAQGRTELPPAFLREHDWVPKAAR